MLQCFEDVLLRATGHAGRVYVLGDEAVAKVIGLAKDGIVSVGHEHMRPMIELVSHLGLVYRFDVARKFGYRCFGLSQCRTSSWGARLLEEEDVIDLVERQRCIAALREVVLPHTEHYCEILRLCSSGQRPLKIDMLHRLNSLVPYPVVT